MCSHRSKILLQNKSIPTEILQVYICCHQWNIFKQKPYIGWHFPGKHVLFREIRSHGKKSICTGILQVYRCSGIGAKIYTVWDFTRRCTLLLEIYLRIKIHVAWEFTSRQMLLSEKWIYAEWDFTSRHMFSQGWLNSVLLDGKPV